MENDQDARLGTILIVEVAKDDLSTGIAYSKRTGYIIDDIAIFVSRHFHSDTLSQYDEIRLLSFFTKRPTEDGLLLLKKYARHDSMSTTYGSMGSYTQRYPFGIPNLAYCYKGNLTLRHYALVFFALVERYARLLYDKTVVIRAIKKGFVKGFAVHYNNLQFVVDTSDENVLQSSMRRLINSINNFKEVTQRKDPFNYLEKFYVKLDELTGELSTIEISSVLWRDNPVSIRQDLNRVIDNIYTDYDILEAMIKKRFDVPLLQFMHHLYQRIEQGSENEVPIDWYISLLVKSGFFEALRLMDGSASIIHLVKSDDPEIQFIRSLYDLSLRTSCRREPDSNLFRFSAIRSPYKSPIGSIWTFVNATIMAFRNQLATFLYVRNYKDLIQESVSTIPGVWLNRLWESLSPMKPTIQEPLMDYDYVFDSGNNKREEEEEEEEEAIIVINQPKELTPLEKLLKKVIDVYTKKDIRLRETLIDDIADLDDANQFLVSLENIILNVEGDREKLRTIIDKYGADMLYQIYVKTRDYPSVDVSVWLRYARVINLQYRFNISGLAMGDDFFERIQEDEGMLTFLENIPLDDTNVVILQSIVDKYDTMMLYEIYKRYYRGIKKKDISFGIQAWRTYAMTLDPNANPDSPSSSKRRLWKGSFNHVMVRDIYINSERIFNDLPLANRVSFDLKELINTTDEEKGVLVYDASNECRFFKTYTEGYFVGNGTFGFAILYRFARGIPFVVVKFQENNEMNKRGSVDKRMVGSVVERNMMLKIQQMYRPRSMMNNMFHHIAVYDYARCKFSPVTRVFERLRDRGSNRRLMNYCEKAENQSMCHNNKIQREMDMIIMEYVENGTLESFVIANNPTNASSQPFDMRLFIHITIQVLGYLYTLYKLSWFTHNDLKTDNIFINHVDVAYAPKYMVYNLPEMEEPFILETTGFVCKVADLGKSSAIPETSAQFDVENFMLSYLQLTLSTHSDGNMSGVTYLFHNAVFLKFIIKNIREVRYARYDYQENTNNPCMGNKDARHTFICYDILHSFFTYILNASVLNDEASLSRMVTDDITKALIVNHVITSKMNTDPLINACLNFVFKNNDLYRYTSPVPKHHKLAYPNLFKYIREHNTEITSEMILNDSFRRKFNPKEEDMIVMNDYKK